MLCFSKPRVTCFSTKMSLEVSLLCEFPSPLQIKAFLVEGAVGYSRAHSTNSASSLLSGELCLVLHSLLIAVLQT